MNIILKKIYLISIGVLFSYHSSVSQTEFSNNNNYDHFLLNQGSIAPSVYTNMEPTLNMLYRSRTGLLKDISNIYSDFTISGKKNSYGGIKIFSQRETKLFAHSKALIIYGIRVPLTREIKMSAGAQIGASNVFFGSSRASGGSASWIVDGGMSLSLVAETWNFSAVINQIPNQSHDFINAQLMLSRYYEGLFSKRWNITKDWCLEVGANGVLSELGDIVNIDSKVDYQEYGSILFGIQNLKSISGGVKVNIPYGNNLLSLIFSHRFGNTSNPLNSSANTVGLRYILRRKM